jgi:hypothetical protein
MILFVAYTAADPRRTPACQAVWGKGLAVLTAPTVVGAMIGVREYRHVGALARPAEWVPMQVHEIGLDICDQVGPGRILTFAPIFSLEGGRDIYPELATGPFAARAAAQLPEAEDDALHLLDEADCVFLLKNQSPTAILTGAEGKSDRLLSDAAMRDGFVTISWPHARDHWKLQVRRPNTPTGASESAP